MLVTVYDPKVFNVPLAESVAGHVARFLITVAFATCMVNVLLNPESLPARILRVSWLRHVGKISYGLYLYHFPIFIQLDRYYTKHPDMISRNVLSLLKFGLAFTVAEISWRIIETPLNKLKKRFPYKHGW